MMDNTIVKALFFKNEVLGLSAILKYQVENFRLGIDLL